MRKILRRIGLARAAEVDELASQIRELQIENRNLRERQTPTWAPPGHFYSPIVNPDDPHVKAAFRARDQGDLEADGVALDARLVMDWLQRLAKHYGNPKFPEQPEPGWRYHMDNPAFAFGDGIVYACMIQELRPKRIVEVGAGYSTCLAMDVLDRSGGGGELTIIEPFPDVLLRLLPPDDRYRAAIQRIPLQSAPIEFFTALGKNDILFIDSSHVAKMGSDVNDYLFRILPTLRSGVYVHIHDIPYPFEYSSAWIVDENRSWNEAYVLHAFLQYNSAFRIVFWNHFVKRKMESAVREALPKFLRNCGAGIWLERV